MMKRFTRYLLRFGLALLAFLSGFALYVFLPPLTSSIRDIPRETPIAFLPDSQNKGKRCEPDTIYVREKLDYDDTVVIDPFCADVQMKLHKATLKGDIASIRTLLAQGANPNGFGGESNGLMRTLPAAAMVDQRDAVRLLLDNGGDVNGSSECCAARLSLLMMAVQHHDVNGARMLLARGADMNFRSFEGDRAFEIAVEKNFEDMVQLLDEAGGLDWAQRAELRIATLPGLSLEQVHSKVIEWNLIKWYERPRR